MTTHQFKTLEKLDFPQKSG